MKKVASTVKKLNGYIKDLEKLVKAADGEASDQLRVFNEYFGKVKDKLGPLIKMIPGLGVFLELYSQAIEQIADSVEQIEEIRDERNRQAREAGIPEPYIKTKTARERAEAEKNKLYKKMTDLGNRIAKECPGMDLSGQEYGEIQEIEDAKYEAEQACGGKDQNLIDEWRIRKEYRLAKRRFSQKALDRAESTYTRMREEQSKRKSLYEKARRARTFSKLSREDWAQINEYLRLHFRGKGQDSVYERNEVRYKDRKKKYNSEDIDALRTYINARNQDVREAFNKRNKVRESGKRYRRAKAANDALDNKIRVYRDCVRKHIKRLANEKEWNPRLVEVLNSSYFRNY
jgi:hypothetical protein